MKEIKYFKLNYCPHCRRADKWINQVLKNHPEYKKVPFRIINEAKERALSDKYNYSLVPCFYIEENKFYEGIASYDIIEKVFEQAYNL